MLDNAQIIPFLTHPDDDLSSMISQRLRSSFDPSPATMDDIWNAVDARGLKRAAWWVRSHGEIPWTESALQRLLEDVRRVQDGEIREELLEALATIDLDLLARHRELVQPALAPVNALRHSVEERLQFRSEPAEQLWQELVQLAARGDEQRPSKSQFRRADNLVEALARHPELAAERSMSTLRDVKEPGWLEIFVVQLLGLIRHRPALDLILDRLGDEEGDMICEEAVRAAAHVGGADAVAGIEQRFASATWTWKLYASGVFERVTLPESEQALMRLIPAQTDASILANLGSALCRQFTTDGADVVRQLILDERYDESVTDLKEELMTIAKVTGYRPPEAEQWERDLKDHDARRPQWERAFEHGRDYDFPPIAPLDSIDPLPAMVGTYRRDQPKVGRNDPCPCGSGKKYKKCCGT